MKQYHDLLNHVLQAGTMCPTRAVQPSTGKKLKALSVFGYMARFDLQHSFPAITGKKLFWRGVVEELLWFLQGSTNVKYLKDKGVTIWDEWANKEGELGPVYGKQWRKWGERGSIGSSGNYQTINPGIDQIKKIIDGLKKDPDGRRHILSAWNVAEIEQMALPPCHVLSVFRLINGKLHCHMTQRSADAFLGVPFNIASYALLTNLLARAIGAEAGELVISFVDLHIYENHLDAVQEYLDRLVFPLPKLSLNPEKTDIDSWTFEDIKLINYVSHGPISAEIAV